MDHFKNNIFSLTKEEAAECKAQRVPKYYWYYLQIEARRQGLKELKEFIKQRIAPLFSESELKEIVKFITSKIRGMVNRYNDGQGQNVKKLDREFNSEIFSLIDEIITGRKPMTNVESNTKKKPTTKKNKKKKSKIRPKKKVRKKVESIAKSTFSFYSQQDKQKLNPAIVFKSNSKKDKYCKYFIECVNATKQRSGSLNCLPCEHQAISESNGED